MRRLVKVALRADKMWDKVDDMIITRRGDDVCGPRSTVSYYQFHEARNPYSRSWSCDD